MSQYFIQDGQTIEIPAPTYEVSWRLPGPQPEPTQKV
jgi:hypothetical protein